MSKLAPVKSSAFRPNGASDGYGPNLGYPEAKEASIEKVDAYDSEGNALVEWPCSYSKYG